MMILFRASGYSVNTKSHIARTYQITSFDVKRETEKCYVIEVDGRDSYHQKRETSNSKWFEKSDDAMAFLLEQARANIFSIRDSCDRVVEMLVNVKYFPWDGDTLFRITFQAEHFLCVPFEILERVDDNLCRIAKIGRHYVHLENADGKREAYIDFCQWHSEKPTELIGWIRAFANARIAYIENQIAITARLISSST
jgi:hypothetical protein